MTAQVRLFPSVRQPVPADFAAFWALYPRRVARMAALKAWRRLAPRDQAAALGAMPAHVEYWRQAERDHERIPHAATWLNGRRWEDELPGFGADADARIARLAEALR